MINEGTFLWQWATTWAPLNGFAIALILSAVAIFATKWTPVNSVIKSLIIVGTLCATPLGLYHMGIIIPVHTDIDLSVSRNDLFTYMNFYGTVLSIGIAVPFLFHQMRVAKTGKYMDYLGQTGIFNRKESIRLSAANDYQTLFTGNEPAIHNQAQTTGQTLKFEKGPRAGETLNLGVKTYTVGRSADNDIVIDDPTVSRSHAKITCKGNEFFVQDLNSSAGTMVDGRQVQNSTVMSGATLQFGNTSIGLGSNRPEPSVSMNSNNSVVKETTVINKADATAWLVGVNNTSAGKSFSLKEGNNTIGRDDTNNLVINDPYVSRDHAVIRVYQGKSYVFDLGSVGGTKINNHPVSGAVMSENCRVKVGNTELSLISVDNPQQFAQPTMSGRTMVDLSGAQVGMLVVKSGVDAGRSFNLTQGDNLIGRDDDSNIKLNDDAVSRKHAIIRVKDGRIVLLDAGSQSGTTINGQLVGGRALSNGDILSVGRCEFALMSPKQNNPVPAAV